MAAAVPSSLPAVREDESPSFNRMSCGPAGPVLPRRSARAASLTRVPSADVQEESGVGACGGEIALGSGVGSHPVFEALHLLLQRRNRGEELQEEKADITRPGSRPSHLPADFVRATTPLGELQVVFRIPAAGRPPDLGCRRPRR